MLCQLTFKCDLLLQCLHSEFFNLAIVVMLNLVLFLFLHLLVLPDQEALPT